MNNQGQANNSRGSRLVGMTALSNLLGIQMVQQTGSMWALISPAGPQGGLRQKKFKQFSAFFLYINFVQILLTTQDELIV